MRENKGEAGQSANLDKAERADDAMTTYSAPQWLDKNGNNDAEDEPLGEHNYAVSFTRNTKPKIGAKIKIRDLPAGLP